ncbi:helix-turn-helix domain-containing protein [Chloroflexota bacterium]
MSEITLQKGTNNNGLVLKISRLRAGLKQYELAAKVGIAPTQLCEIETGRREASPDMLERILKVITSNKQADEVRNSRERAKNQNK